MCEFKVIRKGDGSQITEDIVIANYSEDNQIQLRDILGMPEVLDSALIWDVNTLNQTLTIIEHPIIKHFISLIKNLNVKKTTIGEIDNFISELTKLKDTL